MTKVPGKIKFDAPDIGGSADWSGWAGMAGLCFQDEWLL